MSADLLRRAAQKLRHTAGAAQIGPWVADSWEIYVGAPGGTWVGETLDSDDHGQSEANGAYIALMGPPVALALADCMDRAAWMGGLDPDLLHRVVMPELITVARAVLREPDPSGGA